MKHRVLVLFLVVAAISVATYSVADDWEGHDEARRGAQGRKQGRAHYEDPAAPARNAAYEASCGGCHWAYAPQLLPKKSWENTLATLGDHFGNKVSLSEQEKAAVRNHLLRNAADVSTAEIGRKVMRSLGGAAPARVVEVPYIQRKHRTLAPEILARKGVGGLANCIACHPGAERLDFEDDDARIPAQ
ncbi:MAG: diheme cytochrome c [Desulfovibrio sp.]|jgi:hypothetical protein|nr:diheme cytochrome c [Desulfovibrio sp.]